jgi:sugar lactone lactonase YvrE
MTETTTAKPSRRDFLRGSLALAGAAMLGRSRRAWAAPEGQALAADFHGPWGAAYDETARLYVSDPGAYAIKVFGPDGQFLGQFGRAGSAPDRLNFPTGLSVLGSRLYVCDTNNGRIAVYDLEGRAEGVIGGPGITTAKLAAPNGVCATEKWLWVANTRGHVLQRYDRDGRMDQAFGRLGDDSAPLPAGAIDFRLRQPTAVTVDDQGVVYLLDSKHGRVLALSEEGRVLWERRIEFAGLGLSRPQALVHLEGVLYVADTGNSRIIRLGLDGLTEDARTGIEDPCGLAAAPGRLAVAQRKARAVRVMEPF